jgi:hypothetical protein
MAIFAMLLMALGTAAPRSSASSESSSSTEKTRRERPLLLNLSRPLLGTMQLGRAARQYERSWGLPDDVQPSPTGPIIVWYTREGIRSAVAFTDASERTASSIYYAGPLRTVKGDRIGTPLSIFLKHWPGAQKADTWWSRSYHVQNVWFHFNGKNRLYAVELGERSITLTHPRRP